MRPPLTTLAFVSSLLLTSSVALAQEDTAAAAAAPEKPKDGMRFRFGINATAGLELVDPAAGPMFGIDARLGLQLNNMIAVYAQPHLSFGSLGVGPISGGTGTIALDVLGEVTIDDFFFVGGGFGLGVFNNPSGLALEARAGVYPLMSHDSDGVGRSGLMVGFDTRIVFLGGGFTGFMFMGQVGYEIF